MMRKELLDEYFTAVAALPTAGEPGSVALEAAFAELRNMGARLTDEEQEAIRDIIRAKAVRSMREAVSSSRRIELAPLPRRAPP